MWQSIQVDQPYLKRYRFSAARGLGLEVDFWQGQVSCLSVSGERGLKRYWFNALGNAGMYVNGSASVKEWPNSPDVDKVQDPLRELAENNPEFADGIERALTTMRCYVPKGQRFCAFR